jgi:acyl carrier protein
VDDINQVLKEFIINEFLTPQGLTQIAQDYPLIEEGIVDSMGILLIINFVGARFGANIRPEDVNLNNFENLNSLTLLVNSYLEENPTAQ